jgi:hypothetical protein
MRLQIVGRAQPSIGPDLRRGKKKHTHEEKSVVERVTCCQVKDPNE